MFAIVIVSAASSPDSPFAPSPYSEVLKYIKLLLIFVQAALTALHTPAPYPSHQCISFSLARSLAYKYLLVPATFYTINAQEASTELINGILKLMHGWSLRL